ncbi:MAG: DUF1343 domain-containing protein [Opitutus sp.]
MSGSSRLAWIENTLALVVLALGLVGCSASPSSGGTTAPAAAVAAAPVAVAAPVPAPPAAPAEPPVVYPVMLGIDVLESQGFAMLKGKKVGLLTHPAGVNRLGVSTIDVLRRAKEAKLVALFGPEHGIYGDEKAEILIPNRVDHRTGLPVFSLYGKDRKPTKSMLKGIDAMVIDLQDVGTRSYTYVSAMRYTMEACFENNVEVIVLDRPNPLGGLKADGPLLDAKWTSYVGAFRVPYVHGLTIGELARMAKEAPGVMAVTEAVRAKGRLTIVPMRGWRRSMRWPETGLTWVPTSPMIQDFSAVVGYAMVGLGTYWDPKAKFDIGFRHGVGEQYAFRGLSHRTARSELIERDLKALKISGLSFRRISVPGKDGKPMTGVFVEITDWDDWHPTELSFYLMQMACRIEKQNPFAVSDASASGFLRHMGSESFFRTLQREGAKTDIAAYIADCQARAEIYQKQARRYWLYQ